MKIKLLCFNRLIYANRRTHNCTRVSGSVRLLCNSILKVLRSEFKVLGTASATLDWGKFPIVIYVFLMCIRHSSCKIYTNHEKKKFSRFARSSASTCSYFRGSSFASFSRSGASKIVGTGARNTTKSFYADCSSRYAQSESAFFRFL